MTRPDQAAVILAAPPAAAAVITASLAVAYGPRWLLALAGLCAAGTALILYGFWKTPHHDDSALPPEWTAADWAQLAEELNRQ